MGRGLEVARDDAVDAGRAFEGLSGALDEASAARLRTRLGLDELVWVQVREEPGRVLLAVRRFGPGGTVVRFGAGPRAEATDLATRLLIEGFSEGASGLGAGTAQVAPVGPPPTVAEVGPSQPAGPRTAPAVAPPVVAPSVGGDPTGPGEASPATVPPDAAGPATASPATATPATASPETASPETADSASPEAVGPATPTPVSPVGAPLVSASSGDAGAASAPDAAVEPPSSESAPAASSPSAARATADAEPVETPEPEPEGPQKAMRLRIAAVAFAGIEAFGYGAGARIEIPLFSLLRGVDDSISIGADLGFSYSRLGLDSQGNGFESFQIPVTLAATWRFVFDDIELGPRIGGTLMPRIGSYVGPRATGSRIGFVGMFLVGVTGSYRVADGLGIFAGLDLTVGPRVSVVISAGVAFDA